MSRYYSVLVITVVVINGLHCNLGLDPVIRNMLLCDN